MERSDRSLKTYRYHGHSMADSGATYRSRSEVQDMRHRHDCVEYIKHVMLSTGVFSEEEWEVRVVIGCK